MDSNKLFRNLVLALAAMVLAGAPVSAQVNIQCPCDTNNDGDCLDGAEPGIAASMGVQCMHLAASDGFASMADGRPQYIFSFSDQTGVPGGSVMGAGQLAAALPAPAIAVDEGKDFYLSLTNVGMVIRPDLFDPHTVHFHGFPESSTVFDGLPESGLSINQGATLTYFYHLVGPGTYMYHCHVEATEHMQMGMLGNLYVRPAQNGNTTLYPSGLYAYNDGDGTTGYDVEAALQLGSFDPEFHDASWTVQPLPFALMWDRYPMINGRGYPDTVNPNPLPAPEDPADPGPSLNGGIQSQVESSLVSANQNERVLLRLSNLNITATHTLISPSIPMKVVAIDAKELMDANGSKLHYTANSVTLSGGMSTDVILDTTGVPAGDYYIYAANLQYLTNFDEDEPLGGMMTKIVVN